MSKKGFFKSAFAVFLAAVLLLSVFILPLSALDFVTAANSASESYKSSLFYDNMTAIPLTGDGRNDVIAVALSQLGYREGSKDGEFSGLTIGSDNFTEYNYNMGDWGVGYGGSSYSWCASFVSFCILQSGACNQTKMSEWCRKHEGDADYIWREVSCQKWAAQLRSCGYFKDSQSRGGDYIPASGDLIFFTSNGSTESHIGFVVKTDSTYVYTVEGNTNAASGLEANGEGVHFKAHTLDSTYIRGYGLLPYEVNADCARVDFSAPRLSRGLAVSVNSISVYETADADTPAFTMPVYSSFEITEADTEGRLCILTSREDKLAEGYIDSDTSRALQVYLSENNKPIAAFDKTDGYIGGGTKGYRINSHYTEEKPASARIPLGGSLGIAGFAGFKSKIKVLGYYFDGNIENIVWCLDATSEASEEMKETGGENALGFSIDADTSALEEGSHTVTFAAKLANTQTVLLDSLSFECCKLADYTPPAPNIQSFDNNSVTFEAYEGYEYRQDNGEWQTSPCFSIANNNTEYRFTQRIAGVEGSEASKESEATALTLERLLSTARLTSLTVENASLSPDFDPHVYTYTAILTGAEKIKINADVPHSSSLNIEDYENASNGDSIKITVTSPYSVSAVYTIKLQAKSEETDTQASSADDTQRPKPTEPADNGGCGSAISLPCLALFCLGIAVTGKKKNL